MLLAAKVLIGLVAALHTYFLVLEMFLWTTPFGRKTFGQTVEHAEQSKVLAMNQGLYNGFLVAGLVWSLLAGDQMRPIATFFLGCVVVAGAFGAATVGIRILFVQAMPAALALGALWAA